MGRDACDLYGAAGDIDDKQDVVSDQSSDGADLDGEEVRRGDAFSMSFEKRRPWTAFVAFRSRIDAMFLEDVRDDT